jgi:membrane-bound ClpP family serine protease
VAKAQRDPIIGAILIAIGILVALGGISLGWVVDLAGIAAIVLGIVLLVQRRRESPTVGILLVIIGIAVLGSDLLRGGLATVLNVAVGVVLVLAGLLKVQSKW